MLLLASACRNVAAEKNNAAEVAVSMAKVIKSESSPYL